MKRTCQASILLLCLLVLITCNNGDSVPSKNTIQISSIIPTNSCNRGPVVIQSITGSRFSDGATVVLTKDGETDIEATSVVVTGDSEISCEFDLNGATTGEWDLEISDGTLNPGILMGGFIITSAWYVSTSGDGGNDVNSGTASSPLATIQAAVTAASAGEEVRVSAGTYSVDSTSQIVMKSGVSIRGGYDPDTWEQDIDTNTTTIQDTTSTAASSMDEPHCAVTVDSSVTTETVLEGFTIHGSDESSAVYTSAIFLDRYANVYGPTIRYNTIDGGGGSSHSYGIYARGYFYAVIENNSIYGGSSASTYSYGFYGRMLNTTLIRNNAIDGGDASTTTGIFFRQGSAPVIDNNIIYGGDGAHSYGIEDYNNDMKNVRIRNNTIDGGLGVGNSSYGIYIASGSTPAIENNIIYTSGTNNYRYGIYEHDTDSDPTAVNNNDIFDCPAALYYDEAATSITNISDVNGLTEASDNISVDAVFTDPSSGDFHVGASGLRAGLNGIDQSWTSFPENESGKPIDYEGTERPASGSPWTIGAYEY